MPPPTKQTVLDLPLRRRIVETVAAHAGIHLRKLAEELGVAVSTLEYHCYQLVRTGHLATRDTGGYKAFYPAQGVDRRDKDVLYVVRHEAPRRICAHLILNPGATPKELKEVLGLAGATLTFHLNKLRKAGLMEEEPAGRTKRLRVVDPERVANVLVSYRQSFVDQAVDRFASAWLDLHPPASGVAGQDADPDRPGPEASATAPDAREQADEASATAPDAQGEADEASATSDAGPADEASGAAPDGLGEPEAAGDAVPEGDADRRDAFEEAPDQKSA